MNPTLSTQGVSQGVTTLDRALLRVRLAALPLLLHDSVRSGIDGYRLVLGSDLSLPLIRDEQPVRMFSAGWRPGLLLTLFLPVLLLEFTGEERAGYWLLDLEGRFLGNAVANLDPGLQGRLRPAIAITLRWLQSWETPCLACAPPPIVTALMQCHPDVRKSLAQVPGATDGISPAAVAWFETGQLDRLPAEPTDLLASIVPAIQQLGAGWRAVRVLTWTAPVLLLELAHPDGDSGIWYLDRRPGFATNSASGLTGQARAQMRDWCSLWSSALAERLIEGPAVAPGPLLAWFLSCADRTRSDLMAFHAADSERDRQPPIYWTLSDPLPLGMRYVVPVGAAFGSFASGQVALDPAATAKACSERLAEELVRLVASGVVRWTSPVSGRRFEAAPRSLLFDHQAFAYQIHDVTTGPTFYVLCMGDHFAVAALYFPQAHLAVVLNEAMRASAAPYLDVIRSRLIGHLSLYAPDIVPALLAPPGEVVQAFRGKPAIHLGHFVWQDLSGIAILLHGIGESPPPRCFVFDTPRHPEIYGPLEAIFPELEGKVERFAHGFADHVHQFYRDRQTVVKATSLMVPSDVRTRILHALRSEPSWSGTTADARAAHRDGPVVLVGLRVGNRTLTDMEGFALRLARMLARSLAGSLAGSPARLTLVIDGHNSAGSEPGDTYASFGDTLTGGSTFMADERAIAARITADIAGSGVRVIDLIGRPVQESVLWCAEADFFVAPWGAALAKYRWICNRPGLALAGHWNLCNRHDLDIYHHPAAMEDPAPLLFNAVAGTIDVMEDQAADRANYTLDEEAAFDQVRTLLAVHARRYAPQEGGAPT